MQKFMYWSMFSLIFSKSWIKQIRGRTITVNSRLTTFSIGETTIVSHWPIPKSFTIFISGAWFTFIQNHFRIFYFQFQMIISIKLHTCQSGSNDNSKDQKNSEVFHFYLLFRWILEFNWRICSETNPYLAFLILYCLVIT